MKRNIYFPLLASLLAHHSQGDAYSAAATITHTCVQSKQWASHAADTVGRYSKRLQAAQCCKSLCFLAQSYARSACHKEVSQWSNDINGIGHAI